MGKKTFEEVILKEHPYVKALSEKLHEWIDCNDEQQKDKLWKEFLALVDKEIED